MKNRYRYVTVDVFAEEPLQGNPLAVFPDASGLSDSDMQRIARELNVSETTFVFPANRKDCVAHVRIFTPGKEMAFAGHPTIGTAYALIQEGLISGNMRDFALEENVGSVPVKIDSGDNPLLWLHTPKITEGPFFDRAGGAFAIGLFPDDLQDCAPQLISAGNPTIFIALKNRDAVDRATYNANEVRKLREHTTEPFCVFVFAPAPEGVYARMFAPEYGVPEDPATGSSTGPLAYYMMKHDLIPSLSGTRFISEQGVKIGRRSVLHVQIAGDRGRDGIFVGGHVIPIAEGSMRIRGNISAGG